MRPPAIYLYNFQVVNLAALNLFSRACIRRRENSILPYKMDIKKRVNKKVESVIHGVGLMLLLGFAILVDVLQFI